MERMIIKKSYYRGKIFEIKQNDLTTDKQRWLTRQHHNNMTLMDFYNVKAITNYSSIGDLRMQCCGQLENKNNIHYLK